MAYYVLSDPHGCFEQTFDALTEKGFFSAKENKIILCGDLLDRGKEAVLMSEFFTDLYQNGQLIFVYGNHEILFLSMLQSIAKGGVYEIASGMSHHYRNGTWDTALQLSGMTANEAVNAPLALVQKVMRTPFYQVLLKHGVDYYETERYIFVHGYIPCTKVEDVYPPAYKYNPHWRDASPLEWDNARWLNGMEMAGVHHITEEGKTIICGHFHANYGHSFLDRKCPQYGSDAIYTTYRREGIVALDGATPTTGIVNILVLEEDKL